MRRLWLVFSQAVTVALAVLFVVGTLKPQWITHAPAITQPDVVAIRTAAPPTSVPALSAGSLSTAVHRAAPAVVSVNATKLGVRNPHETDPWYRYFFGDRSPGDVQRGVGSGVIVSPQGYLLTNNHVVEGANEIEVRLPDGREAKARLVGTDPDTDVAVLKVDIDKLPAITLGDVESLQVGDLVLAIGNPFNVGQTVTSGIVSALGRNQLGLSTFENFIQTDAAINPGNSGGALVDVAGNLLGINTAIFSRTGGSLGIGFAIPVSTARQVMDSLIREGRVTRGWIGVEPRDVTPEIAKTLDLSVKQGVLITGVVQSGPASEGGVRPGDVVVKVAGTPVVNTPQLLNAVAALKPRENATVTVQRGKDALDIKVTVAQRPPSRAMSVER